MSLGKRLDRLEESARPEGPVVPLAIIEGNTVHLWGEEMSLAEYEAFKEKHAEAYEAAFRAGQITAIELFPPENDRKIEGGQ